MLFRSKRKVLTTAGFTTWKGGRHFFDQKIQDLFAALELKLPGYEISLQGQNLDEDCFVVAAYNDCTLGARYLYSLKTGNLSPLGEVNPRIKEQDMAPMLPVSHTTRDGLTIRGYLTLPRNSTGRNLPVIVNPHGGPWVREIGRASCRERV